MGRTVLIATLVAGTLDILFAIILTLWFGREVGGMLRYVGSGPIPAATNMGTVGAILGLVTHFGLMAAMAWFYVFVAGRRPALVAEPLKWGIAYGLLTYVVMNWIVVPLRFGTPLPPSLLSMATQLFAHIALVGVPVALITRRAYAGRIYPS